MKRKFFKRLTLLALSLVMIFSLTGFVSSNGEEIRKENGDPPPEVVIPFKIPCGCVITGLDGSMDYCVEHDPANIKPIEIDIDKVVAQQVQSVLEQIRRGAENNERKFREEYLSDNCSVSEVTVPFEIPCGCVVIDADGCMDYCEEHDPANTVPFDLEEILTVLRRKALEYKLSGKGELYNPIDVLDEYGYTGYEVVYDRRVDGEAGEYKIDRDLYAAVPFGNFHEGQPEKPHTMLEEEEVCTHSNQNLWFPVVEGQIKIGGPTADCCAIYNTWGYYKCHNCMQVVEGYYFFDQLKYVYHTWTTGGGHKWCSSCNYTAY